MITLIEALGYRCLRYVRQPLGPFHVLVGPNASGKTTFLEVIAFLGRLVSEGIDAAVGERTQNFYDLVWHREGKRFELAIEAAIPEALRALLPKTEFDSVRYEVAIGIDSETQELGLHDETVLLKIGGGRLALDLGLFSEPSDPPWVPRTILTSKGGYTSQRRTIIHKVKGGNDNFYSETYGETGKGWVPAFKLGPRRSALGNMPADESKFPVSTWFRDLLTVGVQQLVLNSLLIRKASPPGQGQGFRPDGSNLPWVVAELRQRSPERFRDWIAHLKTAFSDLEDVKTVERPEDRHRYLVLHYGESLEVPSWMASDGTLRMLALTLLAYLEEFKGIYLIEEPENGIHPRAIETMTQSLSSVYDAQVLLATHSPVILSMVEAEQVLCFAKTPEGATKIIRGSEHPALQSWKHETTLGTLFAAGVLG
jgi:predicted ATPase